MSDQYPPQPSPYPPAGQYPPAGPYPPLPAQYPPPGAGYPSAGDAYPPAGTAYPPPPPGYPPSHGLPPGYPPQQAYSAPYPWGGGAPMPSRPPYRSARGLAIFAVIAAGALLLAEIIEALTAFGAARAYADAARRGVAPIDVFTAYDGAGLFWMLATCVAYVATCLWLWQARANAELLSPVRHTRARGWIWAGWLVPIVCLWFPFQIVRDIRKTAELDGQKRGPATGLWWGLWLAFVVAGQVGWQMSTSGDAAAPETYSTLGPMETFSAVLAVPAFAVWALLVLAITKGMDQMAARMGFHTVVR